MKMDNLTNIISLVESLNEKTIELNKIKNNGKLSANKNLLNELKWCNKDGVIKSIKEIFKESSHNSDKSYLQNWLLLVTGNSKRRDLTYNYNVDYDKVQSILSRETANLIFPDKDKSNSKDYYQGVHKEDWTTILKMITADMLNEETETETENYKYDSQETLAF